MAQTIAFYSYKGGVGRSLTLASTAYELAANRGRRVICIDFDIEAGGLHTIFGLSGSQIQHTLLDVLSPAAAPSPSSVLLDLTDRILPAESTGRLMLLPTVSDIARLNIVLDERRDLQMLLRSALRQLIDAHRPHYVLIDSRSGFAELASTAMQLADKLVCVLRPNRQNCDGLRLLLDIIALKSIRLPYFTVLSQVPMPDGLRLTAGDIEHRLAELQEILGSDRRFGTRLPFDPILALDETLPAKRDPSTPLAVGYRMVADWIEGGSDG